MNHHDFHNFKAKINDKSFSLTRIFGIFILIIEYLRGNRLPVELNKEQLLKNHKLFETELKRKGHVLLKILFLKRELYVGKGFANNT